MCKIWECGICPCATDCWYRDSSSYSCSKPPRIIFLLSSRPMAIRVSLAKAAQAVSYNSDRYRSDLRTAVPWMINGWSDVLLPNPNSILLATPNMWKILPETGISVKSVSVFWILLAENPCEAYREMLKWPYESDTLPDLCFLIWMCWSLTGNIGLWRSHLTGKR